MGTFFWRLLFVLTLSMVIGREATALAILGYDAERHNRFSSGTTANPSFFAADYDLSGVAINANATLITPLHFVAAEHNKTSVGSTVQFVNSDGQIITRTITGYQTLTTPSSNSQTQTADLVLGTLSAPILASDKVTHYSTVPYNPSSILGRELLVYGASNRAGRNIVDTVAIVSTGTSNNATYVLGYNYDITNGLNPDEAGGVGGDSGKPSFFMVDGQLLLMGIHFAVSGSPPNLYTTYDSLLPYYFSQINALILESGYGLTFYSIPEPSSLLLLAMGVFGFTQRSLRSRVA